MLGISGSAGADGGRADAGPGGGGGTGGAGVLGIAGGGGGVREQAGSNAPQIKSEKRTFEAMLNSWFSRCVDKFTAIFNNI
ncbi:hypothetical protein SAMN05421753_12437 [Planctomicrobium piriforme]|uniref:Uncharacterized protein n=1 Tax=Planctomicrobium piriforme TaxID=1576369 RepID=A0A1I3SL94_9PLAN|nr:hypothetical protein SAMN05421753_12437 [Planctomicrobium piriforme]